MPNCPKQERNIFELKWPCSWRFTCAVPCTAQMLRQILLFMTFDDCKAHSECLFVAKCRPDRLADHSQMLCVHSSSTRHNASETVRCTMPHLTDYLCRLHTAPTCCFERTSRFSCTHFGFDHFHAHALCSVFSRLYVSTISSGENLPIVFARYQSELRLVPICPFLCSFSLAFGLPVSSPPAPRLLIHHSFGSNVGMQTTNGPSWQIIHIAKLQIDICGFCQYLLAFYWRTDKI